MADTIKRQRRADADGEPVVVYFRQVGGALVYRYADAWGDGGALYDGRTDNKIAGPFGSVAELEAALPAYI